jgi:hypothetical protein
LLDEVSRVWPIGRRAGGNDCGRLLGRRLWQNGRMPYPYIIKLHVAGKVHTIHRDVTHVHPP